MTKSITPQPKVRPRQDNFEATVVTYPAAAVAKNGGGSLVALRGHPYWVRAMAAAPAILAGDSALADPTRLLRHLAAAVAFPLAIRAVYWGLRHRQA
jgi:hypothetical protein